MYYSVREQLLREVSEEWCANLDRMAELVHRIRSKLALRSLTIYWSTSNILVT